MLANWLKHNFIRVTVIEIVETLHATKKLTNLRLKQDFEPERQEKGRARTTFPQFLQEIEP